MKINKKIREVPVKQVTITVDLTLIDALMIVGVFVVVVLAVGFGVVRLK